MDFRFLYSISAIKFLLDYISLFNYTPNILGPMQDKIFKHKSTADEKVIDYPISTSPGTLASRHGDSSFLDQFALDSIIDSDQASKSASSSRYSPVADSVPSKYGSNSSSIIGQSESSWRRDGNDFENMKGIIDIECDCIYLYI